MDESNSQPPICPCGFFGSPQTLGLCSKCFRERAQNRSQSADTPRSAASSDLSRQSVITVNSSSDLYRQSNINSNGGGMTSENQSKKSSYTSPNASTSTCDVSSTAVHSSLPAQMHSLLTLQQSVMNGLTSQTSLKNTDSSQLSETAVNCLPASPENPAISCSCSTEATDKRIATKRKADEVSTADSTETKRRRSANSNCHMCNCRLELAVQAIGKCKCGCVFCLLHRLPEQHNCSYDHKEDGRREARAKMVPARKHVGNAVKRLDAD